LEPEEEKRLKSFLQMQEREQDECFFFADGLDVFSQKESGGLLRSAHPLSRC
jgi:hypothetical protein